VLEPGWVFKLFRFTLSLNFFVPIHQQLLVNAEEFVVELLQSPGFASPEESWEVEQLMGHISEEVNWNFGPVWIYSVV